MGANLHYRGTGFDNHIGNGGIGRRRHQRQCDQELPRKRSHHKP
jgi:hypothetical protein